MSLLSLQSLTEGVRLDNVPTMRGFLTLAADVVTQNQGKGFEDTNWMKGDGHFHPNQPGNAFADVNIWYCVLLLVLAGLIWGVVRYGLYRGVRALLSSDQSRKDHEELRPIDLD
jgi:hypothetical protein